MIYAQIAIPDASQCLLFAAPFLGGIALYWLFQRSDRLINWIFPNWTWEKELGWLNIRANRQAETALRWIGYAFYALLALTLYGIVWGSSAFADLVQESPDTVAEGVGKLSVLLICIGIWLVYFGFELIPKLQNQYEEEELEKYRAEHSDSADDEDHPPKSASRWGLSKSKPRSPLPGPRRH